METAIDHFLSQDGLKLYYRKWDCPSPSAILCVIHGLAEHSGRYAHVAEYLNQKGIVVFALDQRGHGLSQGKRGHAKSYEHLLSDVEELMKNARSFYTELPMYLMGHSMGGNVVANFVLDKPTNELSGFILSSPWFSLAFEPPAWKEKLARTIADFWPSLTQPNELDPSTLSRDSTVVEAYRKDPLVHNKISAGLYQNLAKAGTSVIERSNEIKLKGLVFHGSADKITNCGSAKIFADQNILLHWRLFDNSFHEVLNDLDQKEALSLVAEWIKNELPLVDHP